MTYLKLLYAVLFPIVLGFCTVNIFLNKKEMLNFGKDSPWVFALEQC